MAIYYKKQSLIDPLTVRSIAIRCPNWIGDAVMATPVLQEIRQLFPNSSITGISHPGIESLYQGISFFDHFEAFRRDKGVKRREAKRMASFLTSLKPDLGILLTRSFSSAWTFFRAGIPIRLGINDHYRRYLLTHPVEANRFLPFGDALTAGSHHGIHDVELYRKLLTTVSGWSPCTASPKLCLSVSEEEKQAARHLLEHSYAAIHGHHTLIVINPGAAYGSAKCWPKESFRALISHLIENPAIRVVLIGDDKTKPLIDDIALRLSPRIINLAGKTSLRELMAIISLAQAVITNDSGPMHIASALNIPLVALFGSTNPDRTGPFNGGEVLYTHALCSPCYLRRCPIDFRCMTSISVEDVILRLTAILKNTHVNGRKA